MRSPSTSRPQPPHPNLTRRPTAGFGWLDQSLLLDGWLQRLAPDGIAVLVLLALAADQRGASFFGRARLASTLGMSMQQVDDALKKLVDLELLAFRPWKPGCRDGIWQLLALPPTRCKHSPRTGAHATIAQILASLGFSPTRAAPGCDTE
jgi:hypothetical protein